MWFCATLVISTSFATAALAQSQAVGQTLSLEEAFQRTLARSESAVVQQVIKEQSQNILSQKRSALLPQLDSQASLTKQGSETPTGMTDKSNSSIRVGVRQPLFRGFTLIKDIDIAKVDFQRADLSQKQFQRLLWWAVVNVYYETISTEKNYLNLEAQEKVFERREKEIRRRAGLGKSRPADLQITLSQKSTTHAQVLKAKNDWKVNLMTLSQMTGLEVEKMSLTRPKFPVHTATEIKAGQVKADRPDLKAQDLAVKRAEFEVSKANGTLWPELDFAANYYPYYKYESAPTGNGELRWDAGLTLSWVIDWEDWTNKAGTDRRLNLKIEDLKKKQVYREANEELERRQVYRQGVVQQLKDLTEALKLAEKATQLIQRDFTNGTAGLLDIVTQQNSYFDIKRQYDNLDLENDLVSLEIQWLQGDFWVNKTGDNP